MPVLIRKCAVLGAGTMGSRIAAHFTNAGLPVVLLDIAGSGPEAGEPAAKALEGLKRMKPAAFYDESFARRITTGNFEEDLGLVADCDWVVEAVAENLEVKQALVAKVAPHLKREAIFSTNTSGLPVAGIAAKLPAELRRRWLGTHFFNPPRYMRLVEIVRTPETDPAVADAVAQFADLRLGKEVVFARDTPNFIANRIGVFVMLQSLRLMLAEDLSIEEVDALTGTVIGWPRTGTFRLADLVGLDVLADVARNFSRLQNEPISLPPFIQTMLQRRWLGDKTGQGFYKKAKDSGGREVRLALDWKTLEYRPAAPPKLPLLEIARNTERLPDRLRQILAGDARRDKAARFEWDLLSALWNYSADCLPEIAENASCVDRAMRAGFNWEMGPFQLWDAAGLRQTVERMRAAGDRASANAERLLAAGGDSWYRDNGRSVFDLASGDFKPLVRPPGVARVADFRTSHGVVQHNPGASLVDLGDDVGCLELHSPKNAIGEDVIRMVTGALRADGEAVRRFSAFVISGDAEHFSVGANLMQLLLAAEEGEWEELDRIIRAFQAMTASIKFCPRPVVVAPFGYCLGGGAEMALHAARRQAHAELYIGLVETGVGLLPAGGGCKEMTLRATDAKALQKNFEVIAMAKVSASAIEARHVGYLGPADGLTMNRDRLLLDAKTLALDLAKGGYASPLPRTDIPAPGQSALATLKLAVHTMREGEFISDHDMKVANRVAHVLCGGNVTPGVLVSEQYLLDLEREAFLSLCGEPKTQERIAFTLKTGKPLRN